jgi:hypothetical protein
MAAQYHIIMPMIKKVGLKHQVTGEACDWNNHMLGFIHFRLIVRSKGHSRAHSPVVKQTVPITVNRSCSRIDCKKRTAVARVLIVKKEQQLFTYRL